MEVVKNTKESASKVTSRQSQLERSNLEKRSESQPIIKDITDKSPGGFNRETHKPPKIDSFGFNVDSNDSKVLLNRNAKNILADKNIKLPDWWKDKALPEAIRNLKGRSVSLGGQNLTPFDHSQKMTNTILKELRKRESIPDISYDLDGDGFVGGKDYVIARRFDNGQKNYLTEEEKTKAQ